MRRRTDVQSQAALPDIEGVGAILEKTMTRLGFLQKARKYQVFSQWEKMVGRMAKHARPRRLDGDVLFVATASSVWSQELTFMSKAIISKINQALGGEYIKDIRFSEHLWRTVSPEEKLQKREDELYGEEDFEEVAPEVSLYIQDKEIDRALRKTFAAMEKRKMRLLRKGYRACPDCGCLYPPSKKECPFCRNAREITGYNRALSIIDRYPHLPASAVCRLIKVDDPWIPEMAKREVEARWLSAVRAFMASRRRQVPPEIAEAVLKLASLRTERPVAKLGTAEVEQVLGKRMASLAAKG